MKCNQEVSDEMRQNPKVMFAAELFSKLSGKNQDTIHE